MGVPFDKENDPITLIEWGFLDLPDPEPDLGWIKLQSIDMQSGISFELTPSQED